MKIAAAIIALTLALTISACASHKNETSDVTSTMLTEEPASPPVAGSSDAEQAAPPDTDSSAAQPESPLTAYQKMIADTFLSSGNNFRLKKVLEKARGGEQVNIACIGGSVTEGYLTPENENYVSRFYEMFKSEYGNENINYVNAGMSGTNSAIGLTRYERDVTNALDANPDIFIVEYAINDFEDAEITRGAALESMIRDVLLLPNSPAVILLFSTNLDFGNMQDAHIPIGEAYGLPMVSMEGITAHIKSGVISAGDFFLSDHDHPTSNGHKIMAESLMYCLRRIDKEPLAEQILLPDEPVTPDGLKYQGMTAVYQGNMLPEGLKLDTGSFTEIDGETNTYTFSAKPKYPANWKRDISSNNPFVVEVNCKNMLLIYKSSANCGEAEVYIDGKKTLTVDGSFGGGWNNAVAVLLFNDEIPAEHTTIIKMAEESEAKEFTILAFAYTR
ncbi:MAG: SGNH/GDSL hydrolase family protein [Clostridiales bacterium]|jgi:lysophospholipase L1-like esterase|nr:SGNH/GDSL hydrolase family protein [Clostridiales bacterium]